MRYDDLKKKLDTYNWDDGFDVPEEILSDPNCDLALALELFYLADGYGYLQKEREDNTLERWNSFISDLYHDILNCRFPSTGNSFKIPLNQVQKYKLRKKQVPELFLTDL